MGSFPLPCFDRTDRPHAPAVSMHLVAVVNATPRRSHSGLPLVPLAAPSHNLVQCLQCWRRTASSRWARLPPDLASTSCVHPVV
eukprot:1179082-Prorocentrum_minimum.AAC.1